MKKLFLFLTIITISLISYQAKSQAAPGSPSEAAVNFTKSFINLHIKDAEKYMTKNSVASFDQYAGLIESQASNVPDSIKTMLSNATVTTSNEKISGDTATVDVTTILPKDLYGHKQDTKSLTLAKEQGAWKVLLDLSKFMGGANEASSKDSTGK